MSRPGPRIALVLAALALPAGAEAHELRPSQLELSARPDGHLDVVFRVAHANGRVMPLAVELPSRCRTVGPTQVETRARVTIHRWVTDCGPGGLAGESLAVVGLEATGTDVIVRALGEVATLTAGRARLSLPREAAPVTTAPTLAAYLGLGVEHILLGPDHLAFVLGLLLLVGAARRRLLATITAFTVGHSVTLGATALGVVSPARGAVEAIIALSILALAVELAAPAPAAAPSWTGRLPWLFAGVCGLLHGFGFAGALAEIGLPSGEVLPALLGFNLGVELGQLGFVLVLLGLAAAGARLGLDGLRRAARPLTIYALGATSAFWLIQRAAPIVLSTI